MARPIEVLVSAGEKIKQRMEDQGMNQTELAKRAGLSKVDVSRFVNGGFSEPPLYSAVALAKALGWTPDDIAALYGLWDSEQPVGDRRLDRLEAVIDRLAPEDRYYIVELLNLVLEAAENRLRKQEK